MLHITQLPETFCTGVLMLLHKAIVSCCNSKLHVALLLHDENQVGPLSQTGFGDIAGPQKLPILFWSVYLVQVMSGLWQLPYFTYSQALIPLFRLLSGLLSCRCQPACLGLSSASSRDALISFPLPVQVLMSWSQNCR